MSLAAFRRPWGDNQPVYVNPANVLAIETMGEATNIYMAAPQKEGVFTVTVKEGVEEVRNELNRAMG